MTNKYFPLHALAILFIGCLSLDIFFEIFPWLLKGEFGTQVLPGLILIGFILGLVILLPAEYFISHVKGQVTGTQLVSQIQSKEFFRKGSYVTLGPNRKKHFYPMYIWAYLIISGFSFFVFGLRLMLIAESVAPGIFRTPLVALLVFYPVALGGSFGLIWFLLAEKGELYISPQVDIWVKQEDAQKFLSEKEIAQ